MKGEKLKGALTKAPKEKAMERLSPGVYRGSKGGLVSQKGQAIQRQPQSQNPWAASAASQGMQPLPAKMTPEQFGQFASQNYQPSAQYNGQQMNDLMYRFPPGQSPQGVVEAVAGQPMPQQGNYPSLNGNNYQPGTYVPWWAQPKTQLLQQQQQPMPAQQDMQQQMPQPSQMMRKY